MRRPGNRELCLKCKGRGFCGKPYCPALLKAEAVFKVKELDSKDFVGTSPPSVFIGRHDYPKVNVGVLSPVFQSSSAWKLDSVNYWIDMNKKIEDVVKYRSSLINSRTKSDVKNADRFTQLVKEIGASTREVDVEVSLKKKPNPRVRFGHDTLPSGPAAQVERVEATSNIKIKRPVEKVMEDSDLKASKALKYLRGKGFNNYQLQKILSVGALGLEENRKMVPTRWSITATDDTLGKQIINEIKDYQSVDWFEVHHGGFFGNRFTVILMPKHWGYELFECLVPSWPGEELAYTTDHEGYHGRKDYASNCAGGYYAARLGVLEHLEDRKRQALTLVIREVSDEYWAPLGVWVVREAVRKAMGNNVKAFDNLGQTLDYVKALLRINSDKVWSESHALKQLRQKTVLDFF